MTLAVLTKRIQAAVQALGLTAAVSREGDCLVVDLTGPICPDPLLAMVVVEAELEDGSAATAGLEAVKLYGYAPVDEEGLDSQVPSWVSVIDLDQYLLGRAALPPQAFGLEVAEASRLACAMERDRTLSRYPSSDVYEEEAEVLDDAEPAFPSLESGEFSLVPNSLSVSEDTTAEPAVPLELDFDLNLEDPWELELPREKDTYVPFSIDHFPRISEAGGDDSGYGFEPGLPQNQAYQDGGAERVAMATAVASPTVSSDATPMASPHSYETCLAFISDQSSWFAQTVKDNPRLHQLAKQRQHHTLVTLANYLVETLAGDEQLVNLVPVRQRERNCGLILTDQRAIALSQHRRREQGEHHDALQVWMVPWGWVHKVEISNNALCFHYGRARERFSVDLEAPYNLRNSIPRDIPVRMVREIARVRTKTLETKTGLAMVAGVMFALGSGFSLVNNVLQNQRLEQRPNSIALSRRAIEPEASAKSQASQGAGDTAMSNPELSTLPGDPGAQLSVAATLEMTTSHEQCVESFNTAAEPHAYATLNQITQTLQVNLQNQSLGQIPPQQFNQMAASVANEILASCQAKEISHVVVTNGIHRYQQHRTDESLSSVTSVGELKLF